MMPSPNAADASDGGRAPSGMSGRPAAVLDWLSDHGVSATGPLAITRVGIGQSNITTLIVDAHGREWVLREPPPGATTSSMRDLLREAGILRALADTGIPVPRVIGTGESPCGAPFLVMERVAGSALETEDHARTLTPEQRHELGVSVVTTLATLHCLDPEILGIRVSGDPYLVRQIRRVTASWERVGGCSSHDSAWRVVHTSLKDRLPKQTAAVIMHGDYRLSNLLVDHGQITAVLDWELCTIGDPLADLAWLLDDWRPADEPAIVMPSPTRAGGFPDRAEMVEIYREITGRGIHSLEYYRAFSQWRAASLLEGVRVRRMSGAMGTHAAIEPEELEESIGVLLDSAAMHIDRLH